MESAKNRGIEDAREWIADLQAGGTVGYELAVELRTYGRPGEYAPDEGLVHSLGETEAARLLGVELEQLPAALEAYSAGYLEHVRATLREIDGAGAQEGR